MPSAWRRTSCFRRVSGRERLARSRPAAGGAVRRASSGALRIAAGSSLAFAATALLAAPAWALTVSTGQPVTITTTGATVNVTVNPGGDASLITVNYGVTGQPLSSEGEFSSTDTGTSPETVPVVMDQLQPNTSYTYQATGFTTDGSNLSATDTTTATLTTPAAPTGPGLPLVPPQNPPNAIFDYPCDLAFANGNAPSADAACVSDINGGRALEGLPPLVLPSNWSTLTPGEQIFVATNLERVVRGEAPIPNLVNTYDASIQTAVSTFTDPMITAGVPWTAVAATGSTVVLDAIYGWLYYDGPGGTNIDCTSPTAQGCWGHRDALLSNGATIGNPTEMDAGTGMSNGSPTAAAVFVANPSPTPAANIVFSWTGEQQFLAPPALGGVVSHRPAPRLSHLTLSRSRFAAESGRHAPAIVVDTLLEPKLGTIVSYSDSEQAITTLTIEQQLTGVLRHGKCVTTSRLAAKSATSCTRDETLGTLEHADTAGRNRFRYVGRLNGRKLKPGAYLMTASPRNAFGSRGRTLAVAFTVGR